MTGPEIAMAVGDLIAIASLAGSAVVSRRTKRRLDKSKRCPECWGPNAGYIHTPGCPGPNPKR